MFDAITAIIIHKITSTSLEWIMPFLVCWELNTGMFVLFFSKKSDTMDVIYVIQRDKQE